jgi:hypothetical protein
MKTPELTLAEPAHAGDLPAREAAARGVEQMLGVNTRAVAPYNGCAKSIERAFRTFAANWRATLAKVRP